MVLVALVALLASSLDRLSRVDTGFAQGEMLVVDLRHGADRYRERGQLVAFYDELQSRVAALPGVVAVGASYDPPLRSNWYQGLRRATELGVRLALGSSPWRLFGLALRDGMRPALLGALMGTGLALACGRLVASQLIRVKPWDPGLHAAASAGVLAVSLVACAAPAWRAARRDPAIALRHES